MGRSTRKEPDLSTLAKRLTSEKQECTPEIQGLMECMSKQGLLEADSNCTKQRMAVMLCLQDAGKRSNARAQLNARIQRITALFKRHGFK